MKKLTLILLAGALFSVTATAQEKRMAKNTATRPVKVVSYSATKTANNVNVEFSAEYDFVGITPRQEMIVTPVVLKGRDTLRLDPMVFRGPVYDDKLSRRERLYGETEDYDPYETVLLSRKDIRRMTCVSRDMGNGKYLLTYRASFPFQPWMNNSELYLEYDMRGCGLQNDYMASMGPIHTPVAPQVLFIAPAVEVKKVRRDAMTARVMFLVNKYDINPNIFNNAEELRRIYEFTENVVKNEDVEIDNFHLIGYASPEGTYTSNDRLSRNRVNSLTDHLASRYALNRSKITTDNVPEDWDSLATWVSNSNMQYRAEVLNIIAGTPEPDMRDGKIRALDNGQTYNMLLRDVYPQLRRVEYMIEYTVMPFTVEKGKEVLRTNPQHLSLDELYQIAGTYPMNSREYRETFATALRYYPDDPVANNNMAAIAILDGDMAAARRYAEKGSTNAQALNNLGIIYALEGRYDEAREAFRRAMEAGSREASFNYENLYSLER